MNHGKREYNPNLCQRVIFVVNYYSPISVYCVYFVDQKIELRSDSSYQATELTP